ncbi:hypothetical protein IF2G_04603 [Cordyceps javanica]|nr:hypothetical protein IF2G_04603 [Cordyceps javanica]
MSADRLKDRNVLFKRPSREFSPNQLVRRAPPRLRVRRAARPSHLSYLYPWSCLTTCSCCRDGRKGG